MRSNWKIVKIGDIAFQDFECIEKVEFDKLYSMVGVYSYGKGLFDKEPLLGINTSYKTFYKLKHNHIVFSQLFGWEGAIALCSEYFAGKYVSSQFPTFIIHENLADTKYVLFYLLQGHVWKKLYEVGTGMGSRRRTLNPSNLLSFEIPLPPLSEQKRIVEKIESIQKRVEEIRRLRAEEEKEIENIRYSMMTKLERTYKKVTIYSICDLQKGSFPIMKTEAGEYPFVVTGEDFKTANAYDFDCAATCVPLISSTGHGNAAMHRVHYVNGKFALSNLLCAVMPKDKNKINAKFLYELFMAKKDEYFVPLMAGTSNVSLNIDKLGNVEIPLPSLTEQNRIVAFLEKFNQIRQTFKVQEKELTELLPSLLNKAFKGKLIEEKKTAHKPMVRSCELESNYFVKRKMLGTYIINQSLDDEKFGDTKFEKLMHLTEYWAIKRNFNQQYRKQVAGPYDNQFTFNFYKQIEDAGWFEINKSKNKQTRIIKGNKYEKSQKDYGYFSAEELAKVNQLLTFFEKYDYKSSEIISTLFAVWNNRIILQQEIADELLIQDFYDWDKHKAIYPKDQVERGLNWMREKGLVPDGWGEVIEKVEKKTNKKWKQK